MRKDGCVRASARDPANSFAERGNLARLGLACNVTMAKLPVVILTPCVQRAISTHSRRVGAATGNHDDALVLEGVHLR